MTGEQWEQLQELVRKCRQDPLMTPRFTAIEVARTGLLPPSFEYMHRIRVPSFTKQDVWYTVSGNRCNCAAGEYRSSCCHPHYHAACMSGHHPAVKIEQPLVGLRTSKSRIFAPE